MILVEEVAVSYFEVSRKEGEVEEEVEGYRFDSFLILFLVLEF